MPWEPPDKSKGSSIDVLHGGVGIVVKTILLAGRSATSARKTRNIECILQALCVKQKLYKN